MSLPPLETEITFFFEQRHGAGAAAGMQREVMTSVDSSAGTSLERLILPGTLEGAVRSGLAAVQAIGRPVPRA